MSQVNHITNVRPGDRWDGVALNIHKSSFDWSQAQVTVQLRLGARGPLVANVAFSQSAAVDTLVLGFYLTAADTAKLRLGSTYYGTVTVQIPNANPALEPTFGPYTLFTWAMEMSDRAQSGSETYTVEFGSSTVFNISLNEGSTITISGGGDGGGGGFPSAHAATHKHGGSDEVGTGTPSANAIPKADANGKLDAWVSSGLAAGTPSLRALGTGAQQACAGNDGRLSDARTPVAHTHPVGEVIGLGGAATLNVGSSPGTVCAGNDGRLSDNRTPTAHSASHKHGGADEVAVATPAANAIPKADGAGKLDAWITSSGAAATPSLRIIGTGATDACAGNDARLSNARTPTAHTHTSSEITDWNEAVDDRVASLFVAGSNITLSYNDAANQYTISATAGGGGTGANPTALVGLTAVNGSAGTFLRSDGAPALNQSIVPVWTGNHTISFTSVASTPAFKMSGSWFTGGSGTTTKPHCLIEASGATSTGWPAGGTGLGINAATGFGGSLINLQANGVQKGSFSVTGTWTVEGASYVGTAQAIGWQFGSLMRSPSSGVITMNNAVESGFIRLNFGGTTSSFPALGISGTTVSVQLADGTAGAKLCVGKSLAKVGGTIDQKFTSTGTPASAVETDLHSFTTPAASLGTDGDGFTMTSAGLFAGNASATSQLRVYFGGTQIFASGALTAAAAGSWHIEVGIIRDSSTSVRCITKFTAANAVTPPLVSQTDVTGLTLSNSNVLKVTGQGGGASPAVNDITYKLGRIRFEPVF
jgi:hypothetical protein